VSKDPKKKKDKKPKPVGPANPESGGGETGKTRSEAEEKLRRRFDEREYPLSEWRHKRD